LNEQRERNPEKFPEDFAYQLTDKELDSVTFESQNVIQKTIFGISGDVQPSKLNFFIKQSRPAVCLARISAIQSIVLPCSRNIWSSL
jgi:hypothetical protein